MIKRSRKEIHKLVSSFMTTCNTHLFHGISDSSSMFLGLVTWWVLLSILEYYVFPPKVFVFLHHDCCILRFCLIFFPWICCIFFCARVSCFYYVSSRDMNEWNYVKVKCVCFVSPNSHSTLVHVFHLLYNTLIIFTSFYSYKRTLQNNG